MVSAFLKERAMLNRSISPAFVVAIATLFSVPLWPAAAQTWPAKPIKTIQTLGVGGGAEVLSHLIAQRLGEVLGQPVVVEAQGGAGGALGMHQVSRANPDGYILGLGSVSALVLRSFLSKNVPYDTLKDFTPIILLGETVSCVVATQSTGFTKLSDAIEFAKKYPGKLNYGSSGIGTTHHLSGVLVEQVSNTKMLHVPYKTGGSAVQGLISDQVQLSYGIVGTMLPLVKAGKVRILAINAPKRFVRMPEVPTIAEQLPGYDRPPSWNGFLGPAGMPPAVTRRLYDEINKIVITRDVGDKLTDIGFVVDTANPEQFGAYIKRSFELFGKVTKAAGIEPE
jgi:tripartite-type tricarboxylate transporter receptor subunit TctC